MVHTHITIHTTQKKKSPQELHCILLQQAEEKRNMVEQINNAMVNMDEVEEEEEDDNDDDDKENDDNDDNDNVQQDDEQHKDIKGHKSRREKGRKNSRSMATLLAEIRRDAEEHIQERSLSVNSTQDNSDKTARNSHASNTSTRR